MKRILVAGLLSVVAAGAALASDLPPPQRVPPRAPVTYVAPVYNWGGFYFGINGGWGFGKSDWNTPGFGGFGPFDTGNFNINGGLVGGTVGANWQVDAWVFGIEGDFDGSWIDGHSSVSPVCNLVNCETKNKWLATARGRIGYAADRVLFYATGGGAFGDIVANTTANWQSENEAGWTAGGGIEAAFTNNLTARVEYLFVDLQNSTFTPVPAVPVTVKFNANLIRVGLDYKFNY
jgi:outer membrane immunogenic protein